MTALRIAGFAALLAAVLPVSAEPVTYRLDPAHTKVHWEVRHFGTSTHRGRFDTVDGSIVIDRATGRGDVSIGIATASVSSGVPALDGVLRGGSFLAAEDHPTAYFVASRLRFDGERLHELRGEFTLRGVSRPLSLTAMNFACRTDERLKREVCGGDFEAEIRRSDYGSTFGLPFVGDDVRLQIAVEAIRE
ncbi:YceI family protein [Piscinibacter sp.]|uniref:YceI family protein n=1 Tax=Piscinibacter sp. TaxID=1903157 RepID=UPI002BEAA4B1|nr:YceI family protein [Albitalea sp.]HUG22785.1 YceI family protein [Albitalea sp.]